MKKATSNHLDGDMLICRRSVAVRRKFFHVDKYAHEGPTGKAQETKRRACLGPTVPILPNPGARPGQKHFDGRRGPRPIAQGLIRSDERWGRGDIHIARVEGVGGRAR